MVAAQPRRAGRLHSLALQYYTSSTATASFCLQYVDFPCQNFWTPRHSVNVVFSFHRETVHEKFTFVRLSVVAGVRGMVIQ